MKKLFVSLSYILIILFGFVFVSAEEVAFPYDIQSDNQLKWYNESINLSDVVLQDSIKPDNGIFANLFSFFKLSGKVYDTGTGKALNYVKWILNILLWLVGFISLILIVFAFYLIFVTKSEEAVWKAKKTLTWVAVALMILGASWLITSLLFYIYSQITGV